MLLFLKPPTNLGALVGKEISVRHRLGGWEKKGVIFKNESNMYEFLSRINPNVDEEGISNDECILVIKKHTLKHLKKNVYVLSGAGGGMVFSKYVSSSFQKPTEIFEPYKIRDEFMREHMQEKPKNL